MKVDKEKAKMSKNKLSDDLRKQSEKYGFPTVVKKGNKTKKNRVKTTNK